MSALAIARGGGAARGLAHIGLLRAFAEAGIEPALTVGTSMGRPWAPSPRPALSGGWRPGCAGSIPSPSSRFWTPAPDRAGPWPETGLWRRSPGRWPTCPSSAFSAASPPWPPSSPPAGRW